MFTWGWTSKEISDPLQNQKEMSVICTKELKPIKEIPCNKSYALTGTFHGSIIEANSEGEARRIFHKHYKGESILFCYLRDKKYFNNLSKHIA